MATDLQGWHNGERAIQRKLAYDEAVSMDWTYIANYLDEQHRTFHTTRLPFIPVTTIDAEGRPWASIFAGAGGELGFVTSPDETELVVRARMWEGEPAVENLKSWEGEKATSAGKEERFLTAGIGVEFSSRRRNKFAGWITESLKTGTYDYELKLHVNQAIGNCPKYINVRDLQPYPATHPEVVYQNMDVRGRLPDEAITMIQEADTVFLGTSYKAKPEDQQRFPSHAGMNQRGGRPGFVRVLPSDGRTVVLPDFSGNRFLSSLGNIEYTPLAGLTITSFTTGAILYLTGRAKTLVGPPALALMPRQNVLTTIEVTGAILVHDALPVRQRPGTEPQRSPYSPPVKLLAEELAASSGMSVLGAGIEVRLRRIEMHSPTLATFHWDLLGSGPGLQILPGQAAIFDLSVLLGKPAYQHMAPSRPSAINDDRVRTWTVSSAHPISAGDASGVRSFTVTMRLKSGGTVTGALFAIAHKLAERRPDILEDTRDLGLDVPLMGISGEFTLPPPSKDTSTMPRLLWAAGGIGITPFLSMLSALVQMRATADIVFALSTREPAVLLPLIRRALGEGLPDQLHVRLDVFSATATPGPQELQGVDIRWHTGRIPKSYWADLEADGGKLGRRTIYMCGPEEFEDAVLEGLRETGVDVSSVKREGFIY